ncbi:hypothetical protein ACHAXS_007697 [Conticribra weissflogii]
MWSHRDAAIVPWISRRRTRHSVDRHRDHQQDDDAGNHHHHHHHRHYLYRDRSTTTSQIVRLLQTRQRVGTSRAQSRVGRLAEGMSVGPEALAGVGAWD